MKRLKSDRKYAILKNWLYTRPKMETHYSNVYPTILGGVSRGFWTLFLYFCARSAIFRHLKIDTFAESGHFIGSTAGTKFKKSVFWDTLIAGPTYKIVMVSVFNWGPQDIGYIFSFILFTSRQRSVWTFPNIHLPVFPMLEKAFCSAPQLLFMVRTFFIC